MTTAQSLEQIEEQAAAWVWRIDNGQLTDAEVQSFEQWLAQDSRHQQAYASYTELWGDVDNCQLENEVQDPKSSVQNSKPEPRNPQLRNPETPYWLSVFWRPAGAFALGLMAVLSVWFWVGTDNEKVLNYQTAIGEYKNITMADGTAISLNTNSSITVAYSSEGRLVSLEQGEVHFSVAKDPERPFVVFAGNTVVRAVGTAFNLYRRDARTLDVIVTEGVTQVTLFEENPPRDLKQLIKQEQSASQSARLEAAQRVEVGSKLSTVENISAADMARTLAWQQGMLIFEGETLEQAVKELARYSYAEIVIADPKLRELKVGGYFKADNIDNLLKNFEKVLPIRVNRTSDQLVYILPEG